MKEPKEITKQESDRIREEWHKSHKPFRPLTVTFKNKYYDVRELSIDEVIELIKEKTGKIVTKDQFRSIIACYR